VRLTAQEIARYRPPQGKADHIVFDADLSGFGLRYRAGKRTWIYQYAFGSGEGRVNARMTLGVRRGCCRAARFADVRDNRQQSRAISTDTRVPSTVCQPQ
jgi:hypothetical protein